MTMQERRNYVILKGSRKQESQQAARTTVADVNKNSQAAPYHEKDAEEV